MDNRNVTEKLQEKLSSQQHYTRAKIEPIDYIKAHGMNFIEGNVVKYISRYKHKNGLEDLVKCRVYLDMLITSVQDNTPREDIRESLSDPQPAHSCIMAHVQKT